ncbi:MAG: hypothetical protein KY434_06210 [Actinobacteria bacterium]|nr:hypothetical protein [Actinomycetota bacterium]
MNDEPNAQRLNREAFEIAKAAADEGVTPEIRGRADQIAEQIKALRAEGNADESLLTDAYLDVNWVRSNCTLPSSTRVHWYLEDKRKAAES